ncbi:MAG TPA: transposase [Gammaproteobacteria bacterium]|nr:transposase [Gammaproteobacteria bacterium]
MKIKKAFRYRLKPTAEQLAQFETYAGHCRFVWNKCWQINIYRLQNNLKIMYYQEMDYWSKLWKKSDEYGFLQECPAHCIQQKLRDLERAYKDGFDKSQPNKRMPTRHKKGIHDSFRFPEPKQIELDHNRIKLPKLGWVKFFHSRKVKGDIKHVTISREGNHWYISINVEQEVTLPKQLPTSAIGIDLGVANFAALSNGTMIAPINSFRNHCIRLAILQRRLAKKQKFSNNWKKILIKLRKLHRKITNIRHDFVHKLTTHLSKSHAMVVVEALKITNMSKSAKGNITNPGKNVHAKSGLNKSILDQGWGEFKQQLKYKLEWLNGTYVEVAPQYTSQKCSKCGHTNKANRTTQASFCCKECYYTEHADINAALNILAAGHAVMACGASA